MVAEIRCDKCGEFVGTNHTHGHDLRCANCNSRIEIPSAVSMRSVSELPTREIRPGKIEIHDDVHGESVLSQAMPWVLSMFFHVGLGVIMLFFAIICYTPPREKPDASQAKLVDVKPESSIKFNVPKEKKEKAEKKTKAEPVGPKIRPDDVGGQKKPAVDTDKVISVSDAKVGINGPATDRIGGGLIGIDDAVPTDDDNTARADNVVYVIDRSGSMVDTFNRLQYELRKSIALLDEDQRFHVIMFTDGEPMELITRRLISATDDNKLHAGQWIDGVRAEGQTDPAAALERAFAALKGARGTKLIYFLTDGLFRDDKAVLGLLARLNADKSVHINTFLYGDRPDSVAEAVMKQIASDNGGRYDYVNPKE